MKAGDLRHRVKLQQAAETRDAYGAVTAGWVDVATVWAAVEPLAGREFFAAKQVNAEATGHVRIRYRAGVLATMRVVYGTRVFEIIAPPNNVEERNRELILMVKELVQP
jgi:SPP1 family predicted phage head-tail adaptor